VTWLSVRTPSVILYLRSTITMGTYAPLKLASILWLISSYENMLSTDHFTIFRAQVKTLSCFCCCCSSWPGSGLFYWIVGKSDYYSGLKDGVNAEAWFRHKLTPVVLLTFLATYASNNRLLESPWHITRIPNWYNRLLKLKSSETTHWTITCLQLIIFFFEFLIQENQILF